MVITGRADFGGGPKNIYRLLKGMNKTDFSLTILCPDDKPFADLYGEIPEVRVFKRSIRLRNFFKISTVFGLLTIIDVLKIVASTKPNIIHSHDKSSGLWSRGLKLFFPKVKVIHHYRGLHYKHFSPLKQKCYFVIERFLSCLSYRLVHVSASEAALGRELRLADQSKQIVIHNGVENKQESSEFLALLGDDDTSTTESLLDKKNEADEIEFSKTLFTGVTIARFCYQKNLEDSFLIIAEVVKWMPDFQFIVVGGEDEYSKESVMNRLEELEITKNVVLTGFQKNVLKFLEQADFYLSTARWEGLPTGILEAMMIGLPIVASKITGNVDVVDSDNGYLFPLEDKQKFVDAILELSKDQQLVETLSKNSEIKANAQFSVGRMIAEHEKLYLEACRDK